MQLVKIKKIKEAVSLAVLALKEGKVLILPTDTVYGFVALDKKAVKRIYGIKKRDKAKPLPFFVSDTKMAQNYAHINKNELQFLKQNWPGAITAVFKAKKGGTIALRQPDSKLLLAILREVKQPLAQTSANISGEPATGKIKQVLETFESASLQPDILFSQGDLPERKPSKVIDFSKGKRDVLRG